MRNLKTTLFNGEIIDKNVVQKKFLFFSWTEYTIIMNFPKLDTPIQELSVNKDVFDSSNIGKQVSTHFYRSKLETLEMLK